MGVFVKHGGDAHKRGRLPQSVVRAARELEDFYHNDHNNNNASLSSSFNLNITICTIIIYSLPFLYYITFILCKK